MGSYPGKTTCQELLWSEKGCPLQGMDHLGEEQIGSQTHRFGKGKFAVVASISFPCFTVSPPNCTLRWKLLWTL